MPKGASAGWAKGKCLGLYSDTNCANWSQVTGNKMQMVEAICRFILRHRIPYIWMRLQLKRIPCQCNRFTMWNRKFKQDPSHYSSRWRTAGGQHTVYKEGEELVGADVAENGTTFKYEKRRQKGAVYDVYAGADIKGNCLWYKEVPQQGVIW